MGDKKAIAMSFNWIFSLVAGAIILFLAIYGVSQLVETGEKTVATETSAKLVSLLDPFETGLASGMSSKINFKKQTKIYFACSETGGMGPFGKQTISFSEQTFGDKYGARGGEVPIKNKYVFAEEILEGKKLHIFSLPFSLPFKIADLIIISTEDYCFFRAPNKVKDDIEGLNMDNVFFVESTENCTGMKVVCFGSHSDCHVNVIGYAGEYNHGRVVKGREEMHYTDNLLYAAIFSSQDIYECNVKRLLNKFKELSLIYIDKIGIIRRQGCDSPIDSSLRSMIITIERLSSSEGLIALSEKSKEINSMNEGVKEGCKLY